MHDEDTGAARWRGVKVHRDAAWRRHSHLATHLPPRCGAALCVATGGVDMLVAGWPRCCVSTRYCLVGEATAICWLPLQPSPSTRQSSRAPQNAPPRGHQHIITTPSTRVSSAPTVLPRLLLCSPQMPSQHHQDRTPWRNSQPSAPPPPPSPAVAAGKTSRQQPPPPLAPACITRTAATAAAAHHATTGMAPPQLHRLTATPYYPAMYLGERNPYTYLGYGPVMPSLSYWQGVYPQHLLHYPAPRFADEVPRATSLCSEPHSASGTFGLSTATEAHAVTSSSLLICLHPSHNPPNPSTHQSLHHDTDMPGRAPTHSQGHTPVASGGVSAHSLKVCTAPVEPPTPTARAPSTARTTPTEAPAAQTTAWHITVDTTPTGDEILSFTYSTRSMSLSVTIRCPRSLANTPLEDERFVPCDPLWDHLRQLRYLLEHPDQDRFLQMIHHEEQHNPAYRNFTRDHSVYPRATCSKQAYKGHRWKYETECNRIGWHLAFLNPHICHKKGLLQRAVDLWRNSRLSLESMSRRLKRQIKPASTKTKPEASLRVRKPARRTKVPEDQSPATAVGLFPGTNSRDR